MQKFLSKNFNKYFKETFENNISNPIKNTKIKPSDYNYTDANLKFLKMMNIEF